MRTLPTTMIRALAPFAPLFSKSVWQHVQVLVAGTILAPGRRTVSSALRAMGLAAFYEQHKDNPAEIWGEPEQGPPSEHRRPLSATITVRFSPEDASAIRDLAQELNISYSEIVRRAVRKFVHSRLAVGEETHADAEDGRDYSFSTGIGTRTGTPVLAGR